MISILLRAMALLDAPLRRRFALTVPLSVVIMSLELMGFVGMAAAVQALAAPQLIDSRTASGVVGVLQDLAGARSATRFVALVGGLAVGMLILRGVAASALAWWQAGLVARAEAQLSSRLFRSFMAADFAFHLEHHSADLLRTVNSSVRSATSRVMQPGVTVVTEIFLVAGLAVALFVMEPVSALASLTVLGGSVATYLALARRAAHRAGVADERHAAIVHRIAQEGLSAVKVLTILGRRQEVADRFEASRIEHARATRGVFFVNVSMRYYLEAAVLVVAGVVTGTALLEGHEAGLASIGILLAGCMRLLPSVQRLMAAWNLIRVGAGSIDTLERDLALARAGVRPTPGAGVSLAFDHAIELRDVNVRYPAGQADALASVNLRIRRGASVGIVGRSGSGKTTLVDVLTGLLTPTSGDLCVDGVRVTGANLPAWQAQIGYVPQETTIVDDTVRRNVALGLRPAEIDDAAVRRALARAQLLDTVLALPDGLDTRLGERGVRMSHGQRQRIGIARALYHEPRVLVLDEATAALDTATEAEIVGMLEDLRGDLTLIVIAHRLSTVERSDTIVRVEDGRIVSVGMFRDVVAPGRPSMLVTGQGAL
jgi:ATP-binding cassette, subfamily B, bacterial PglK